MENKAQSAIEFIIILSAISVFFTGFMLVLQYNVADKNYERADFLTQEIALNVQNEVDLATNSVDGYTRQFSIPARILGSAYNINVTSGFVYVRTTDGQHSLSYPTGNVTGYILKGANTIRKINGTVYFNP